jgi:thiol:disulfide interchange protein DsbD
VGAFDGDEPRVEATLVVHPDDSPLGDGLRLGVHFELDPGWHLYWKNPGETGLPTELRWSVEGGSVGPVRWPAPTSFRESEDVFTTYGYEEQVLLMADAALEPEPISSRLVRVDVELLVCESSCLPASFSLQRRVDGTIGPEAARVAQLFRDFSARVPREAQALGLELRAKPLSAVAPGGAFRAQLTVQPTPAGLRFYPDPSEGIELEEAASEGDEVLAIEGRVEEDAVGPGRLRGVLEVTGADRKAQFVAVDLPLPVRSAAGRAAGPQPSSGLLRILALALLGGLVLNLMPCVLPVLAIKIVTVTELAHQGRRVAAAHAMAYTAGILLTMLALAAVVVVLRSAGSSVGWGFQFQEPLFVAAISTVLVVFALNFFGVYEIGMAGTSLAAFGEQATGAQRSFFEGLLAVVLSTPCSAPFLGTAVGFAFASSAPVILTIFAAIGLGLASPFVAVSLVPGAARLLPRPGAWMAKLRTGLGFALLATVVWLLWILGRSAGVDALALVLGFLVAVAFATWIYGSVQTQGHARLKLGMGAAAIVLGLAGLNTIGLRETTTEPRAVHGDWIPFAPAAVQEELASGSPVFVDFTADWCITCAANERLVLADERVLDGFRRGGFTLYKADWTRRDETIRAELARFGKAGVPLYLVYHPDAPDEPKVLSELLTVDQVLDALGAGPPDR